MLTKCQTLCEHITDDLDKFTNNRGTGTLLQARCYMKESRSSMMAILYFLLHHHYSSNIFGRLEIKLYLCTINF